MSQRLHTMLTHINRHAKVIEAVQNDFHLFSERLKEREWLAHTLDDFEHLGETIRVDYLDPLEHMIDLVSSDLKVDPPISSLSQPLELQGQD